MGLFYTVDGYYIGWRLYRVTKEQFPRIYKFRTIRGPGNT